MPDNYFERIIKEYMEKKPCYEGLNKKLQDLIKDLLDKCDIRIHSIEARIKSQDNLEREIKKPDNNYKNLNEITDISGIRIITYFEDDVDEVADIIKKEFQIDEANSVDKRKLLDPDRFGYLSLHYVVEIKEPRISLPEYKEFKNIKTEIQIRSILQHAWAEIEHDLGYKTVLAIPRDIRRKFSRIAGILEMADEEFIQIRKFLSDYQKGVVTSILKEPKSVLIDKISLSAFVQNNLLVRKLDKKIANIIKRKLEFIESFIEKKIKLLEYVDIRNIEELDKRLNENASQIIKFAEKWIVPDKEEYVYTIACGISIFYLLYVIVGKSESFEDVVDYIEKFRIYGEKETQEDIARKVIETYRKIT